MKRCEICKRPKRLLGARNASREERVYALGGYLRSLGLRAQHAHISCAKKLEAWLRRRAQRRGLREREPTA